MKFDLKQCKFKWYFINMIVYIINPYVYKFMCIIYLYVYTPKKANKICQSLNK